MSYTTFNQSNHDATKEPMFFGRDVGIARYDLQKYPIFEKLIEKQLSFFWRPEEVDVTKDRIDFNKLPEHEKHIFVSNLKYQILLDSVQGRGPNMAFLPVVSIPELETWIEVWGFSETIHSRSYTHIIRNIFNDPSEVFDEIVTNERIIDRATALTKYYDDFIRQVQVYQVLGYGNHLVKGVSLEITKYSLMKALYLVLAAVNVLEGVRFYVSFACSFAFAERKLMEGNAKIIRHIARDEALHLVGTQQMMNLIRNGSEGDEFRQVAKDCESEVYDIFAQAVQQEKEWAEYLFKDGSMIGLNKTILNQYIDHIADKRMSAINLVSPTGPVANPIPWMSNWLESSNLQVAPQETEISSYLVGQIDSSVSAEALGGFKL